ncbi:MAG: trypsin-like peptidase domain-containing protein [Pseudomonadota bacterium]|nr:trypsin-like peptidase domain-containing protein [Pseudomonadota bacterium]
MQRFVAGFKFIAQFTVLGLALAFVLTRLFPEHFGEQSTRTETSAPVAATSSFAEAVRRAGPWVVSISAERVVAASVAPIFGDPTWQRYSEASSPVQQLTRSLGSGVIMSADGYVLTNFHVIQGAQLIRIGLWDERVTSATLVGVDPATDLAVLKIDGSNFPTAKFADESKLEVGDVVLAIGNPYGLDRTVTMGVISATRRNILGRSRFENFLQTDAAVNDGNSGGALINTQGELVGINTANLGNGLSIGFAIPAAAAREVLQQIVKFGEVVRGWMGAVYFDASYSPVAGGTASQRGVQITRLLRAGPADNAGLRPGDIVLAFDDQPVIDGADLRLREAALAPGTKVEVSVTRAGIPLNVEIELMRQPSTIQGG